MSTPPPLTPPDTDLIARILVQDDRHAFAELVRRHQSPLRVLLRRLTCGNHALADDLAQETLLRAYRGLRNYRGGAKFSSWLYRIGYNVFLSDLRQKNSQMNTATAAARSSDKNHQQRQRTELQHDLEGAMNALRPLERGAITLNYFEELTHQEIAQVLDCPLGTIKTHINRGKEKLRKSLAAWGGQK